MGQKVLSLSKSSPQSSSVAACAGERVREQTPGPWVASVDAYQGDPAVLPEVGEDRPEVREQDWELPLFPRRSAGAQVHSQASSTVPSVIVPVESLGEVGVPIKSHNGIKSEVQDG